MRLLWVLALFSLPLVAQDNVAHYHLTKSVPMKGDTGWDYLTVDTKNKQLFVTRGTRVAVVDMNTGAEIGNIPDTNGVHGVALASDLDKGFVSNGKDNSVTIFEPKSLKVLGHVTTEKKPDAIVYEPQSKRVFAFNGDSHSATAIDAVRGKSLGNLPLDGKPEFAVASRNGFVFVNLEDKSEIVKIDPVNLKKIADWPLAPCEEPTGLAIDSAHGRLFAGCGNKTLAVFDADSGKVVTSLPIGQGVDAVAFDPESQLVFSSNGDGTLTVIHEETPDHYKVVENVPTQKSARTLALDPETHRIYLVAARFQERTTGSEKAHGRPPILPGSVTLLILDRST
jgi:DNA-binding beta-propeller fold protein YncE